MRTIVEALDPDISYRMRQRLGPWITRVGRTLGEPEYQLRESEYVGTIGQPLDEFTEILQEHGFDWDPLAWYHQSPTGSDPNGSWTYRRSLLADRQLHVILIARTPEKIDVFAHEEYNWLRHPISHLRQVGIEREAGSNETQQWIERRGIEIDIESRLRRSVTHTERNLRKRLRSAMQ